MTFQTACGSPQRLRLLLRTMLAMAAETSSIVTDRERIAAALAELALRGYWTISPFRFCCSACGWAEIARRVGATDHLPPGLKTVWWHAQTDSLAFCGHPDSIPQTPAFMSKMPHDPDAEWFAGHSAAMQADAVLARVTQWSKLVGPLFLHWRGDCQEIVAALRAQHLRVQVPQSVDRCIAVLPPRTLFSVETVSGEVLLHLEGEDVQLTAADARLLARKVSAAAREANDQVTLFG